MTALAHRGKIPALDGLRGIAALLVVLGHLQVIGFGKATLFSHVLLNVDFFFVLSGFVIGRAYEQKMLDGMTFRDYASIRLRRLYPLISLGIVLGFLTVVAGFFETSTPVLRLLAQLLFIPSLWVAGQTFELDNVQWSLLVEIVINFAHFFVAKILPDMVLIISMVIFAISLLVLTRYYNDPSLGWTTRTFFAGFPRGAFGFSAGLLLFRLTKISKIPKVRVHWFLLAATLPIVIALASWHRIEWRWYADPLIVIVIMPAICWSGIYCRLPDRVATVASFLGALSYPIYAIHLPIIYAAKSLTPQFAGPAVSHAMFYMIWLPIIIGLSWLALVAFDNPIQKWMGQKRQDIAIPSTL